MPVMRAVLPPLFSPLPGVGAHDGPTGRCGFCAASGAAPSASRKPRRVTSFINPPASLVQLRRNAGAADFGEALDLLDVGDGHDAGNDGHGDAGGASARDEFKILVVVEEQLRDEKLGAGADLPDEVPQVLLEGRTLHMLLR